MSTMIILEQPLETLPTRRQDEVFKIASDPSYEVFSVDENGVMWQVLNIEDLDRAILIS
jgi:hypothetical protein